MESWELVGALRQGDERAVSFWHGFLAEKRRSRELATISREEATGLIARGGDATRAALSDHPDGRVREAALRALSPSDGSTLDALLRRANDWVPVVARLAGERALASLTEASDDALLNAAPLVFALTRQRRVDHRRLVDAYLDGVRVRRGLAQRVRRAYRNGPVGEWASWRIVGGEETAQSLRQERLRTGTPRLQIEAARQVVQEPGRWWELLHSRNPQVRRIALDHAPPEAIEAALDDPNAGVRNDARYLLGRRDHAAHYRRRLSGPVDVSLAARLFLSRDDREELERRLFPAPGAVSGLGETGTAGDAETLLPFLKHPRAEVRARAVEAIFRLRGDAAEPFLLAMLLDPVLRVKRTAVDALVRSGLGLDPVEVLRWPLPPSLRLRLLQRTPRWTALLAVLQAADTLDGAEEWIVRWVREADHGRTPPKPDEWTMARSLLGATSVTRATQSALAATLDAWRP